MIQYLNDVSQVWWQWMGSMFWQVSLLIIIVSALDMIIRKWAWPQVRYAIWALVFIKLVISPAWQMPTSIISLIQPRVEEQITFNVDMSDIEKRTSNIITTDEDIVEQVAWQSYALLVWISGVIIFSIMLLRKTFQFQKQHRGDGQGVIPEWFNELMTKTGTQLELKKLPSVIYSKDAKSPAVYGVFRPILSLPDGYLDKLSKEQAEHIIIHELCHIKRGDLLIQWLCVSLQIVYWFNPLLIWTRRQMRYVCEICCDLSVANMLREKTRAYRETLLNTAREFFAENMEPSLGFLGIFEEPFRLVPRLKWLEKKTWENRKLRIIVTLCTSLLMVACVMPMSKPAQKIEIKEPLNLNFHDTDIIDVLPIISKATEKNIVWDPDIKGRKISMELKDVPRDEALDIVLKKTGLERKNVSDNIILVTMKEKNVANEEAEKLKESSDEKVPKKQYKGKPIYLYFENADVTHILKLINEVSDKKIIWDPAIKGGKISITVEDVSWDEALDIVLKKTGLERKNIADNIIWITTRKK